MLIKNAKDLEYYFAEPQAYSVRGEQFGTVRLVAAQIEYTPDPDKPAGEWYTSVRLAGRFSDGLLRVLWLSIPLDRRGMRAQCVRVMPIGNHDFETYVPYQQVRALLRRLPLVPNALFRGEPSDVAPSGRDRARLHKRAEWECDHIEELVTNMVSDKVLTLQEAVAAL